MRPVVLALVALTSGCSLTALEEDAMVEPTKNTCEADSDCPGGTCDSGLGVCKATQGDFANILLEITPPASVVKYGGIGFLKEATNLPLGGGQLDANIDFIAKVSGSVEATSGNYSSDCTLGYGPNQDRKTVPVKLTFTPTARILGLAAPEYVVTTGEFNAETGKYGFEAWMPADTYDIYVEPDVSSDDYQPKDKLTPSCKVAPQFVYNSDGAPWNVPAGDLSLSIVLQPPSLLSVVVPSPVNLAGWTVEMVHPTTGRVLSAPVRLEVDGDDQYVADLEYTKLQDPASAGKELVRIRPCSPDDPQDPAKPCEPVIGPTLVVERQAVELFTEGKALIDQLSKLDVGDAPNPKFPSVTLSQMSLLTTDGSFYGGSATVRFVSKDQKLDLRDHNGPLEGVQAFFDQTVTTDSGVFDVTLLPGEYDVYVAPTIESGFATTHTDLLVSFNGDPAAGTDEQSGKTIQLEASSEVRGIVVTANQDAAVGAEVQAVATPVAPTKLQIAAGATPFKPQALSGSVNTGGDFALEGDPGILDFSVLPAEGTAFPWLVRPNVEVKSGPKDLGEMEIGWPVIYTGNVTTPGEQVVGGALIRVYIYLDDDGYADSRNAATGILQIAETRADADGTFRLFLPPHLN